MNREDVIQMAGEAGLAFNYDDFPNVWYTHMDAGREEIEHFAALVAAAEREACAKVCDAEAVNIGRDGEPRAALVAGICATAIRARGQGPPR